jgi:hypothetical protein
MKTVTTLGLTLCALLLTAPAQAGITEGLGHWQGSGVVIAPDGQEQGEFTVEVDRVAIDARTVEVRGKVTHADGQVFTFSERQIAGSNGGFLIEGSHGKGGGRCFGGGLCQTYVETGADTANATTIAVDGPDKLRVLVTALDHGRAIRFIRQSLTRKQ